MLDLPSGIAVAINPADFEATMALKNAMFKEVSLSNADLGVKGVNLADELNPQSLIRIALAVDSSPEVNAALWKCLTQCLYDGEKITKATFDPVEARADYYPIVEACLALNLASFLKPLVSKLFVLWAATHKNSPPSK